MTDEIAMRPSLVPGSSVVERGEIPEVRARYPHLIHGTRMTRPKTAAVFGRYALGIESKDVGKPATL